MIPIQNKSVSVPNAEVSSLAAVAQWSRAGAKYHHFQHRRVLLDPTGPRGNPKYIRCVIFCL